MFRLAALGGRIDNWSREPGFPAALGDPHPDALSVEQAVHGLRLDLPAELSLADDMAGFGINEPAALRRALPAATSLIVVNAKVGRRPPWDGHPRPSRERGAIGKPKVLRLETTVRAYAAAFGTTKREEVVAVPCAPIRAGMYPQCAYAPLKWDPDPAAIVRERAEYLVWWAALDHIAAVLQGQLSTMAALAPLAPARPWAGDRELGKPGRVFEALREETVYRAETPARSAAGRRRARRRCGRSAVRPSWAIFGETHWVSSTSC